MQKEKIPQLTYGGYSKPMITAPLTWTVCGTPGYGPEWVEPLKLLMTDWTEKRPLKLGAILYDQTAPRAAVEFMQRVAPTLKIDFVGFEVVPMLAVDTTTELRRLAAKNPDWIYAMAWSAPMMVIGHDVARLELEKRGIKFCGARMNLELNARKALGAAVEGWYELSPSPAPSETELPGVKAALEAAKRYRDWEPRDISEAYITGFFESSIAVEALRLAVEKVGFENLTGVAVRDALTSIKDFDSGFMPPITVNEDSPWWPGYIRLYRVQQGKWVPISDWVELPYTLKDL